MLPTAARLAQAATKAAAKFPPPPISAEPGLTTVARSAKELWPFVLGFATTGYIFVSIAGTVTDEDVKNSKFTNPKH